MASVGYATLQIVPVLDGFNKAISKATEPLGTKAGQETGTKFGGGLVSAAKSFAAPLAAAIGASAIGKSIFGAGWNRLTGIENAQAKLKGIGHDAQSVDLIMQSALASVKGTAYGLGDAATIAAGTVAAGIKPGEELTRTLTLTANAAALSGTSLTDMGSILNKVWTAGRVQTQELNQLADRGVPIWTKLAEHYGVSADALRDMVSRGEVDAATFATVLEGTVGTAASAMGQTTEGSIMNFKAALGRIGANLMGGVFPLIAKGIQGLTSALGPVEDVAKRVGDAIGNFATSGAGQMFSGIAAQAGQMAPAFLSALGAFSPLSILFKALQPVMPELAAAFGTLITALLDGIAPVLPLIAQLAGLIVGALANAFVQIMPVVTEVVNILAASLGPVLTALTPLFDAVIQIVMALLPPILSLIPPVLQVVEAFLPLIPVLAELVTNLLPILIDLFNTVIVPVVNLATQLINKLAPYLEKVAAVIRDQVVPFITRLIEWFGKIVAAVAPVVSAILGGVVNALSTLIGWLGDVISKAAEFAVTAVGHIMAFANGVATHIEKAIQWFRDLPGKIGAAVSGAANWLVDTGRNIVQGLINGISDRAGRIVTTIKNKITDVLPSFVKDALGIHSPSRVFMELGHYTAEGMALGIAQGAADVQRAADGLIPTARAGAFGRPNVAAGGLTGALGASAAAYPTTLVVVDQDGSLIGRMRVEAGRVQNGTVSPLDYGRSAW